MNTIETHWTRERKRKYISLKKHPANFELPDDYSVRVECKPSYFDKELYGHAIDTIQFGKVVNANDFDENIFIPFGTLNNQIGSYLSELLAEIQNNLRSKIEHPKNNQRELEMTWIANNIEILNEYKGQWICIEKNQLIGYDKSLKILLASVREKGIVRPFVYFLPFQEISEHHQQFYIRFEA